MPIQGRYLSSSFIAARPAAIIINGGGKHIRHDHSTTNMIAI